MNCFPYADNAPFMKKIPQIVLKLYETCISHLFLAGINHYDQKQLAEDRTYFGLWLQRETP